ncbi:MAG: septum formation initiator family protein [Bacteroidota bacterium]
MAKKNKWKKLFVNMRRGNIPWYVKNRYVLAIVAFLVWMTFFDRNNVVEQYKIHAQLSDLRSKKEYYAEQIKIVRKEKQELFTSMASLEKFAREHYMMKKSNEDLFVIVPSQKTN